MPPRRSARVAAVVERATSALPPLPHAIVLLIFAQLPADLRARCACVCRGWRAVIRERLLWTALDLSPSSGVVTAVTDALLRRAAARAGGKLQALNVCSCAALSGQALLAVARANANALRELRAWDRVCNGVNRAVILLLTLVDTEALLRAAPALRVLEADVHCGSVADARRTLHAEGLLAPLRVRGLRVHALIPAAEADVLALATDVASHAWVQELCLVGVVHTPAALDAVVHAAAQRRLASLYFVDCRLTPACAPALARLLSGGGALRELLVWECGTVAVLDAPGAALLADALRASTTLTWLHLGAVGVWRDAAVAAALLGALTAHASLRTLSLSDNSAHDDAGCVAAGALLRALLAANAPALTELDIEHCLLGDAGLRPLLEALPRNTHLRTLVCSDNNITAAFAADVLLPAVRANASLRVLTAGRTYAGQRSAEDAVNGRAAAR
jgi:hypothetical protein